MMRLGRTTTLMIGLLVCASASYAYAAESDTKALLDVVKKVGPRADGHAAAINAIKKLSAAPTTDLPLLLAALNDAGPLQANWIRGAIETIFDRAVTSKSPPATADLETFITTGRNGDRARRLAFELLTRLDPAAPARLLPGMLDDPSLELRRDAIDAALAKLKDAQLGEKEYDEAYAKIFRAARDIDQIGKMTEAMRSKGQTVDLPRHFGFVMEWKLIGPFDNREKKGFNVAYPPEQEIDPSATYPGKEGPVKWIEHVSSDQYGDVDLTVAIGKHKGAIAYALADFEVDKETPCQLRLGSINANKIWLNGTLLHEREVYHASTNIDQYSAAGLLKPGRNTILLKIAQNEQTEVWAQDWKFQLRVCDDHGTPIYAKNRPATPAAALVPPPKKDEK